MVRVVTGSRRTSSATGRGSRVRRFIAAARVVIAVVAVMVSAGSVLLLGVFAVNPD